LILAVLCLFTFFVNNGSLYTEIMESRNIVTAREMVYDGHWMIPTMNGNLRLEKPPLPTWFAAFAETIAPDNVAMQRSMAGLAATFLVLMLVLLALELTTDKRYAIIVSIILCTSYNIILMGRTATWDIFCHAFMMGALLCLFKALRHSGKNIGLFVLSGFLIGFSFMSKGPVSLYALMLPFLIAFFSTYKVKLSGKWGAIVLMILVATVVSSWWYLYVYLTDPGAFMTTIVKESSNWSSYNTRPWYYYYGFSLETGFWAILCITALFWGYWRRRVHFSKEYTFSLLWMLSVVIILSLLPEKKTRYLLPMLMPAALTMGHLFSYWVTATSQKRNFKRWIYYLNTIPFAIISFALPSLIYIFMFQDGALFNTGSISTLGFILTTIFFVSLGFYLLRNSCLRIEPMRFLYGVSLMFIFIEAFLMPSIAGIINNPDFKGLDRTVNIPNLAGVQFYHDSTQELRIEQVYDAHRTIKPLDIKDSAAVMKAMPCVILTRGMADTLLPANILDNLEIKYIGRYDGNRRRIGTRFYKKTHIWNVTIIKLKQSD